jgi:hypothetical protein
MCCWPTITFTFKFCLSPNAGAQCAPIIYGFSILHVTSSFDLMVLKKFDLGQLVFHDSEIHNIAWRQEWRVTLLIRFRLDHARSLSSYILRNLPNHVSDPFSPHCQNLPHFLTTENVIYLYRFFLID